MTVCDKNFCALFVSILNTLLRKAFDQIMQIEISLFLTSLCAKIVMLAKICGNLTPRETEQDCQGTC